MVFQSVGRRILYGFSSASMKEEGGQHVHGWENITIAEVKATAVLKNKLVSV